jgi:CPA1 family monovalent cation:H+ antiporter
VEHFLNTEALIIELLFVIALVAIAVRRLRMPYTVALVIAGLLITLRQPVEFSLTPELILALFVPPLVFEAAFHLSFSDLQRNMRVILLLTVPGVILTTLLIGGIVMVGAGLSLPIALVFGALISATDPVAVVALFKTLGAPKRLRVLVESESLLNDGTALVVFNLVLAAVLTGHFSLLEGVGDFVRVAAGGTLIGLVMGWAIARLVANVDDYLIETTLTTVLAYGAYLAAERLGVSGVLAVVAAGLVNGNIGPRGMSPTTRIVLFNFWEYVAFLANSLIFLLIGLQVSLSELWANWQAVAMAVGGVLVARVVVVYGLAWLGGRLGDKVPLSWQHILSWGGLRGALSLALVLSLPAALGAERELLRVMTFGVVLFTLLVQGLTMGPLLRQLRIGEREPKQLEYEIQHSRLAALRAAEKHLERQYLEGIISTHTWEGLRSEVEAQAAILGGGIHTLVQAEPALGEAEMRGARRELLRAQRSALMDLQHSGVLSEEGLEKLAAEIDGKLTSDSAA